MNKNLITFALLGWTVAECLCPVVVNHYQPHAPHVEEVEPVQTVAVWQVTGALASGVTFTPSFPYCTGAMS